MNKVKVTTLAVLLHVLFFSLSLSWGASALVPWGPMDAIKLAAQKEGKVSIYAPGGHVNPESQRALTNAFEQGYKIAVEWTVMPPGDIVNRVQSERRIKRYLSDIAMGGFLVHAALRSSGHLLPILAPSSMEENIWRLNPDKRAKSERDWLYINLPYHPGLFINTRLVSGDDQVRSYKDLLQPKWKGKIVIQSPGLGGTGSGWFTATYRTLGLDYMKAVAKQVVLVQNVNDSANAVAQGQYAIGIAVSPARSRELIVQGAPVRFVRAKEGSHLSTQGVMLLSDAPHLNAAKLFLHWFFSKEGQRTYVEKQLAISVRKDIPQDYLPSHEQYIENEPLLSMALEDEEPGKSQKVFLMGKQIFEESR